jgi:hypothetical protein
MLNLAIGLLLFIGIAFAFLTRKRRPSAPRIPTESDIGTEVRVGHHGLSGSQEGSIVFYGNTIPAKLAPGGDRLVLAEGEIVIIRSIEHGVVTVAAKD